MKPEEETRYAGRLNRIALVGEQFGLVPPWGRVGAFGAGAADAEA